MMATIAQARYSAVARLLHWLIALFIIANLVSGFIHDDLDKAIRGKVMGVHMSLGITILFLSVLRLAWRLGHKPPPLPAVMTRAQVGLAHAVHWGFYALIVLAPLSGWIMVSQGTRPLSWFGLVDLPKFAVEKGDMLAQASGEGHEIMALLMATLLVVHIAAALWHQFIVRDNLMARMR